MTEDDFDKDIENDEFADEFDFVDEQHVGAPTAQSSIKPDAQGKMPGSNKNYAIYGIVAAVVLVASYLGFNMLGSDNQPVAKAPLPTPVPSTSTNPLETNSANTLPAGPLTSPTDNVDFNQTFDAATQDNLESVVSQNKSFDQVQRELKSSKTTNPDAINATLDSISEEMTLNVNQIKHLETTITSLAATVEQLNKSISAMDNRVLGLTETVDGLAQDLSNVKKVMADEDIDLTGKNNVRFSGAKKHTISNTTPDYSVHAIIPGRAWLKNSSGQIITVTEGDKLGDFGTIAVIDATNGIVRTSSGITIR